jgi:hypothetical protein
MHYTPTLVNIDKANRTPISVKPGGDSSISEGSDHIHGIAS